MTAFLKRMPAGIVGALTRAGRAKVEPLVIWPQGTTGAFSAYGLAGVIDATSGQFRVMKSTDTYVRALLVRNFPTQSSGNALGAATPADGVNDAMVGGYMSVKLQRGVCVKGGPVFVRIQDTNARGLPLGGFEAAADAPDTLAVPVATAWYEGPADASGNVEIAFNV